MGFNSGFKGLIRRPASRRLKRTEDAVGSNSHCAKQTNSEHKKWTCGEEESCADHKIICFDIESRGFEGKATHFLWKRYNTKEDNWGTFERNLVKKTWLRILNAGQTRTTSQGATKPSDKSSSIVPI